MNIGTTPAGPVGHPVYVDPQLLQNNITASFSFSPRSGFQQVNSALLTILHVPQAWTLDDVYWVGLNKQPPVPMPIRIETGQSQTVVGNIAASDLRVGANTIDIALQVPPRGFGNTGYRQYNVV